MTKKLDFLQSLQASALLNVEQFKEAQELFDSLEFKSALTQLVKRRMLTEWQIRQLVEGDSQLYLGKYRLQKLLVESGDWKLFLGHHEKMGRRVAIQLFNFAEKGASRVHFLEYAKRLASLDHPHVVHVFDFDEDQNDCFLVMEELAGCSFGDYLKNYQADSLGSLAKKINQIAMGLHYLHQQRIVHGNLRTSRVLVDPSDNIKIWGMNHSTDSNRPDVFTGQMENDIQSFLKLIRKTLTVTGTASELGQILNRMLEQAANQSFCLVDDTWELRKFAESDSVADDKHASPMEFQNQKRLTSAAISPRFVFAGAVVVGVVCLLAVVVLIMNLNSPHRLASTNSSNKLMLDQNTGSTPNQNPDGPVDEESDESENNSPVTKDAESKSDESPSADNDDSQDSLSLANTGLNDQKKSVEPQDGLSIQQDVSSKHSEDIQATSPDAVDLGNEPQNENVFGDDESESDDTTSDSTEPEESPADDEVAPTDPFTSLPSEFDLPAAKSSFGQQFEIGEVAFPDGARCFVDLIGGETAHRDTSKFKMRTSKTNEWIVELLLRGHEDQAEAIGRFAITENGLAFQWLDRMSKPVIADYLRNCILRLRSGEFQHHIALRNDVMEMEPIRLLSWKSVFRKNLKLASIPDSKTIRFELVETNEILKGVDPKLPISSDATKPIVFYVGPEKTVKPLVFQVSLKTKRRLPSVEVSPFFQLTGSEHGTELNRSTMTTALQTMEAAKHSLPQRKKDFKRYYDRLKEKGVPADRLKDLRSEEAAVVRQIETTSAEMEILRNLCNAIDKKGLIRIRIYYQLGEHEIDLLRCQPFQDDP